MDANVKIDECGMINVKVHVRGIRAFRMRMMVIGWLLRVMQLVAPKNVNVELCDECLMEDN